MLLMNSLFKRKQFCNLRLSDFLNTIQKQARGKRNAVQYALLKILELLNKSHARVFQATILPLFRAF